MGHDEFCNCEDCVWARDGEEVCPTCGSVVGSGCTEGNHEDDDTSANDDD